MTISAMSLEMRQIASNAFINALREISVPRVFETKVECFKSVLRVEQSTYDLSSYSKVLVLAMGKAAETMLQSLIPRIDTPLEGIVACSYPSPRRIAGFRHFQSGHPLPTEESMQAAKAMLKYVSGLNDQMLVLYLMSGGASAMVESPHDKRISISDLAVTYNTLVNSGATIAEINAIRKHLSSIKGGRLAQAAFPARQVSIMISDVPEGSLDALASGPTMPDRSTTADCYRIAEAYDMTSRFPEVVRRMFEQESLEETPKVNDPVFASSHWYPILSSALAAKTAAVLLSQHEFTVEVDDTPDDWPHDRAAKYLLARVRELRKSGRRVAVVSAGEITIKIDGGVGIGGRNQHFALYCAQQIEGENISVLSASTDGIDGNSLSAGAVVDGTTAKRARILGIDLNVALEKFDSFSVFQKLGDVLIVGPTGNNVRDIRMLLAW